MRAMLLEFPEDPASDTLDRQYMLGDSLLVAPVFTDDGSVSYYLPAGRWTHLLTGEVQEGSRWHQTQHGYLSLPLFVRPNTILPVGADNTRPDYDYTVGTTFRVYELADGATISRTVPNQKGDDAVTLTVTRKGGQIDATIGGSAQAIAIQLVGVKTLATVMGGTTIPDPLGVIVRPTSGAKACTLRL